MLFEPAKSENGLYTLGLYAQDTWRLDNRLTVNLGVRFDHYRNFLPEQEHAAGQFTTGAIVFPAVDNLNTWNLVAPRIGMSLALTSDGRTVLKANYGQYWWNPGAALSQDVNPNPETWNRRYVWNDLNGDLLYQPGEEGRLNSSAGGVTSVLLAEDLKDTYTQRSRVLARARGDGELRRAHRRRVARRAAARDVVQRQPAVLGVQRAGDRARSRPGRRAQQRR